MRRAINREIPRIVDHIKSSFILKSHSFKFKSFGAGIKQNRVMIRGNGSEMWHISMSEVRAPTGVNHSSI